MKKYSILTLALLVLFSPALGLLARDGAPQEQLVGKVESVKGDQLTLLPADGKSVLIRLTADTLYTSGKKPATRTDVKAGLRARVTVNRDGETLSAQAVSLDSAEGRYACPMHPEVHQPGPGSCPRCNMNLEWKP